MPTLSPANRERAAKIRMIVLDSDGVLTDGRIVLSSDGTETRAFDVTDGFGIRLAQRAGIEFGIISGRRSEVVARRAAELGIEELRQQVADKRACLEEILLRRGLPPEAVCFIGDDLIDLPAMRRAGFSAAPSTALPAVRESAHFVASRGGGRGAVREVVELVLRASGRWEEATKLYFDPEKP